jgi:hypothetical protein
VVEPTDEPSVVSVIHAEPAQRSFDQNGIPPWTLIVNGFSAGFGVGLGSGRRSGTGTLCVELETMAGISFRLKKRIPTYPGV